MPATDDSAHADQCNSCAGDEKAVYGYSLENYSAWRVEYPQHATVLVPGGFGENLCIEGMREVDLCVGDIHRIGSSRLQICQPRQPCFKAGTAL